MDVVRGSLMNVVGGQMCNKRMHLHENFPGPLRKNT